MPTLTEIQVASVSEFHFEQDHIMCGNVGIPGPMLALYRKDPDGTVHLSFVNGFVLVGSLTELEQFYATLFTFLTDAVP